MRTLTQACPWLLAITPMIACHGPAQSPALAPPPTSEADAEPVPSPPLETGEPIPLGRGESGEESAREESPSEEWVLTWSYDSKKKLAILVGASEGRVYTLVGDYMSVGAPSTDLIALGDEAGDEIWAYRGDMSHTSLGESASALYFQGEPWNKDTIHVVAVNKSDGKKAWMTKVGVWLNSLRKTDGDGRLTFVGAAEKDKEAPVVGLDQRTGQVLADEATAVLPQEGKACSSEGSTLTCPGWTRKEAHRIQDVSTLESRVCFSVDKARELRCRDLKSGALQIVLPVQRVEKIKYPDRVNFTYLVTDDWVFVGTYDGQVLAYSKK